jgi:hypothetical protein
MGFQGNTGATGTISGAVRGVTASFYQFVLADASATVPFQSGATTTAVVPPGASVSFPIGTVLNVIQWGTGKVTFAAGTTAVTINSVSGYKSLNGQYSGATLELLFTDTWSLLGNITT